jgi:hypothetical protein
MLFRVRVQEVEGRGGGILNHHSPHTLSQTHRSHIDQNETFKLCNWQFNPKISNSKYDSVLQISNSNVNAIRSEFDVLATWQFNVYQGHYQNIPPKKTSSCLYVYALQLWVILNTIILDFTYLQTINNLVNT